MSEQRNEIAFHTSSVNGIRVHILPTAKFKTTTIVTMIEQELSEAHVTKTALLAMLMKRATARFPETKQLREHLDFLYGATFDVDVVKKGSDKSSKSTWKCPTRSTCQLKRPFWTRRFTSSATC
nr:hypothetical protein [Brevibacillus aydinogluensis]